MMPGGLIGILVDITITGLLVGAITTSLVLYHRLKKLRPIQEDFERMIGDYMRASDRAETALQGLMSTAEDISEQLEDKLRRGEMTTSELQVMLDSGERIAARMEMAVERSNQDDASPAKALPDFEALAEQAAHYLTAPDSDLSKHQDGAPGGAEPYGFAEEVEKTQQTSATPQTAETTTTDYAVQSQKMRHTAEQMSNIFTQTKDSGVDPFDALFGEEKPQGVQEINTPRPAAAPQTSTQIKTAKSKAENSASRSEQELLVALQAHKNKARKKA